MTTNNPWESANDAQVPSQHYFGELTLNMWYCALIKGQGKVEYDPAQHGNLKRFTAIDLSFFVPNPNGQSFNIERQLIAESKEWTGTILPSIHALNLTPMTVNKRWCHIEMIKTGTYTKNGETKDLTNPRLVAVYDNEQACTAAAAIFFGRSEPEQAFDYTAPATNGDLHPAAPADEANRRVALQFITPLVGQAQGDEERLRGLITGNGLVKQFFGIDSPEVQEALHAYRAKQLA